MEEEDKMGRGMPSGMSVQSELLRAISEQNRERILEYDAATDIMCVYNVLNGQFVLENEIHGYAGLEDIGKTFLYGEDREKYRSAFDLCLEKPMHMSVDLRCVLENGEVEWNRLYLVSVAGKDRKVDCVGGRFLSIHEDKVFTEQMRKRAEIDALTGVYNHIAFEEVCGNVMADCAPEAFFLMLDVDDFKRINDTQGHTVGDMVLQQTGEILSRMVEGHGIAGRLGGDEFAVFVWGMKDGEHMRKFCSDLRDELKTIVFDMEYSASMGVSALKRRPIRFMDLYCEADQAVYGAKNAGKDRVVFFEEMERAPEASEPAADSYGIPASDDMDEHSLLGAYGKCMGFLTREDYRSGLKLALDALLNYFDADCLALVLWEENRYTGISECHRDSAGGMARILTEAAESGREAAFQPLIDEKGSLFLYNIKEIAERFPIIFEKLTESRIWSVAGHEMSMDYVSHGALLAINPRKHLSERALLHMLSDYLVSRVMMQRVLELREYETTHDRLTGLWNRNSFILRENEWRNERYGSLGIVTTDIVGLSYVNRDFGYLVGSRRLVAIARLLQTVYEGFRIYRYDNDEMLVCCPNVSRDRFELMLARLAECIKGLDFMVAAGSSWSSHACLAEQLVEAELSMKQDRTCLLQGEDLQHKVRQSVEDEMKRAMREGRYRVYMQPKVNVHSKKTVGAEALIRQFDPDLGIIGPSVFIPVLERYELIHLVDLFVLEQVFAFQRAAIDEGREVIPISTNFSRLTILHPDTSDRVRELAEKYGIPKGLIHIEVTEPMGDMDRTVVDHVSDSLKELGFGLSMDDFGTHDSSLAVLVQYNFDSANIDRSMIMDISTNERSRMVVDYMTSMISELGINCIAEGVETKEQADIMKETKCEVIQGYYFGKPIPQEEFYDRFM